MLSVKTSQVSFLSHYKALCRWLRRAPAPYPIPFLSIESEAFALLYHSHRVISSKVKLTGHWWTWCRRTCYSWKVGPTKHRSVRARFEGYLSLVACTPINKTCLVFFSHEWLNAFVIFLHASIGKKFLRSFWENTCASRLSYAYLVGKSHDKVD